MPWRAIRIWCCRPPAPTGMSSTHWALETQTAAPGLASPVVRHLAVLAEGGMFIFQPGSWKRRSRRGDKAVIIAFRVGKPTGLPPDVLSGFLTNESAQP